MRIFSTSLITALVGIFSITSFAAEADVEVITIDHGVDNFGLVVDVMINGEGPYSFLIDTASSFSLIKDDLAKTLRLKTADQKLEDILSVRGRNDEFVTELVKLSFFGTEVERETRLTLVSDERNWDDKYVGVIGVSELLGAKLKNFSAEEKSTLDLPKTAYGCDILDKNSRCSKATEQIPHVKSNLFGHDVTYLLDTGYLRSTSYFLFDSAVTRDLLKKYFLELPRTKRPHASAQPLGVFSAKGDPLNPDSRNDCYNNFWIQAPYPDGPLLPKLFGTVGWSTLRERDFEFDFATGKVLISEDQCSGKTNTLGIKSILNVEQDESIILEEIIGASPVDEAGLLLGDEITSMTLEDGTIIDKNFSSVFNETVDQHVFSPAGTKIIIEYERDGKTHSVEITSADPFVLP